MSHARRTGSVCLVALALLFAARAARLDASERTSHVRVLDGGLRTLIADALSQSDTFRNLVARLDAEPIRVFVRCEPFLARGVSAAGLNFVASAPGVRYVGVFIRCGMPSRVQLPLIAHELQHALEVAGSPDIVDAASLAAHYQGVGFETFNDGHQRAWETDAARAVQYRVEQEVFNAPARQRGPELVQRSAANE